MGGSVDAVKGEAQASDISAYIVDRSDAMRNSLDRMLRELGVVVCGQSPNGTHSLESIRVLKPDLILLDILIPGSTSVELFSDIRQASPESKAVILTMVAERTIVMDCRRLGACDYVLKPFEWTDLRDRMARLIRGMMTERQALSGAPPAPRMAVRFDRSRGKVGACCRHCGRLNPLENVFCGSCGRILNVMDSNAPREGASARTGSFYDELLADARRDKEVFLTSQPSLKQGDIEEIFDENDLG